MDLHSSILKAFLVVVLLGFAFAPRGAWITTHGTSAVPAPPSTEVGVASATTGEASAPTRDDEAGPCGAGMLLVEGDHCPEAHHVCTRWLDPPPYHRLRCAEYKKHVVCKKTRVPLRFCIDRQEYAETSSSPEAEVLPLVNKTWGEAKALCEARGARLCREAEWELACEGPDMSPYPYGWKRDASICNFDRTDLGGPMEKLKDHRAPLSAYPDCLSPFGVHNMVGNVDEWVEREGMAPPNRSALRGGWWLPGRNRCRAATLGHGEEYSGKQVGFRCCNDAPPDVRPETR